MNTAQIVLIEDSPADVLLIDLALKETGIRYELTRFASGREALAQLGPAEGAVATALKPDVILLDLNTPKSDGFEILRKLKLIPECAQVPIAIISSSPLTENAAAQLGSNRYIQKPSELDEFLAVIGQAVTQMLNQQMLNRQMLKQGPC